MLIPNGQLYLFNINPEQREVYMLVPNGQLSGFSPLLINKFIYYSVEATYSQSISIKK